jgi:YVTN family beta-propeller protein
MTTFFSTRPQYNSDVAFTTCTLARQASTTPAGGGFTEIQFLPFAPGKAAHYQNNWVAFSDFEFGRVWLRDQSQSPQPPIQINLSPGERSCPFSLTLNDGFAYVVGREGEAGTPTANCNNWVGVWKVDLSLNSVVGFAKSGTKLRDAAYGMDNRVYVTDFEEDKVYVVNSATMSVERSINVGDGPVGIKLNPSATGMWVTNWNSNKLQYWNLTNDTLIDEEDSGGVHPVDVFISGPNGFVLNFGDAGANIGGSLRAFEYSF